MKYITHRPFETRYQSSQWVRPPDAQKDTEGQGRPVLQNEIAGWYLQRAVLFDDSLAVFFMYRS